jgi:hypothetical protein
MGLKLFFVGSSLRALRALREEIFSFLVLIDNQPTGDQKLKKSDLLPDF